MEEIELREALLRHVQASEPPMGLTAETLLAMGRRQQRWRIGLTLGSGSAATAITIVGALTLAPIGGSLPSLDDASCVLPIASQFPQRGWPEGTDPPVQPTPWPSGLATDFPSPNTSTYASLGPPSGYASDLPSANASDLPAGYPSLLPSDHPNAMPKPAPTASDIPWLPFDVPKTVTMDCYLARQLTALLPAATFMSIDGFKPMQAHFIPSFMPSPGGPPDPGQPVYTASTIVVNNGRHFSLCITVIPSSRPAKTILNEYGTLTEVIVHTGRSKIVASVTDSLLSAEELTRLASAPELDLFR